VSYYLANGLAQRGVNVELCLRFPNRDAEVQWANTPEASQLVSNGVRVKKFYANYSLVSSWKFPYYVSKAVDGFSQAKPDVVHFNSPPVDANLRLPGKLAELGVAQTIAIHGGLFYEGHNFFGRIMFKRLTKHFSAAVVFNSFSNSIALTQGFPKEKIRVIPNGVDTETISKIPKKDLEGDPSIVFAGRLEKIKGVETLVEAVKKVRKTFPSIRVYFIGTGAMVDYVRQAQSQLAPNIVYLGKLPRVWDVVATVKGAHFYVLPSLIENFSISLLEAMASGTPILVSNVPGNSEVLSDEEAWIFERGSSNSLSEKIENAYIEKDASETKARKALTKAQKVYDWKIITTKYYELFSQLTK
jgi:glycosyltransferase involved in cell wall biosynthesis